jgi:hypothetical protein
VLSLLFFLLGCGSDHMIAYKIAEKETVHAQDIFITVPDNGDLDGEPIWVDHFVQPNSVNGVDILWVIDPSGSMNDDTQRILGGIGAMMAALPPAGWRLAIIPADYRFSQQENQFPLVPGDTIGEAETMYNNAMAGAFEAGFDATYGYIVENPYSNTWMRNDAALLVVFVSDEDEQSQDFFNNTQEFISWYRTIRSSSFIASIINLDPSISTCNNTSMHNGDEYIAATNHFGGQIIDICSEDWTAGVLDASNQIKPHENWPLSHKPLDSEHIYVFHDGVPVLSEVNGVTQWHYEPIDNTIYFDIVPNSQILVEIAYYYDEQDTGN